MNFQIKHRQTACPPDLSEYIASKLDRLVRLLPENHYIEFEISDLAHDRNNGSKRAEIIIDLPGQPVIRYDSKGETFYEAVDKIIDRADQELGDRHNKRREHTLHGVPPKEWVAEKIHDEAPLL